MGTNNELYNEALEYFSRDNGFQYASDLLLAYPEELIYCYENKLPFNQFTYWANLQYVFYEKLSYDDYYTVATAYPDSSGEFMKNADLNTIGGIREFLYNYRSQEEKDPTFFDRIKENLNRILGRTENEGKEDLACVKSYAGMRYEELNDSQKAAYEDALEAFSKETYLDIEKLYPDKTEELIYCYENRESLFSFQNWAQLEDLLGQKVSFDEYANVHAAFGLNLLYIEPSDKGTIFELKHFVDLLRKDSEIDKNIVQDNEHSPIESIMSSASERSQAQALDKNTPLKQIEMQL